MELSVRLPKTVGLLEKKKNPVLRANESEASWSTGGIEALQEIGQKKMTGGGVCLVVDWGRCK